MEADKTTHDAVVTAATALAAAYTQKDVDTLLGLCVPDADLLLLGAGGDELKVGADACRAGVERDLAQVDAVHMTFAGMRVSALGDVAWFYAACNQRTTRRDRHESILLLRCTGVLVRREGKWLFAQCHFSLPAPEAVEGESFAFDGEE